MSKVKQVKKGKGSPAPRGLQVKGSGSNAVCLLVLSITVLVAFSSAFTNGITNWDDDVYITKNALIRSLDLEKIFTSYVSSNYHPLTILSYAIEYHLLGIDDTGFHVTNILIHVANTLLVFLFIQNLSGNKTIALVTALLFGIHPMHVESVAWISERKDVLYAFFFLLSLIYYLKYIHNKGNKIKLYLWTILFFLLSLLSKGMAVSLPLVMVLVDYYRSRKIDRNLILEKIPFFLLSLVFGLLAISAQRSTQAMELRAGYPIFDRILFVCYGAMMYIVKLIAPLNLSSFYPYPQKINGNYPLLVYLSPVFVLLSFAAVVVLFRKNNKMAIWGIIYFVATIILVLQFVPVGDALFADRYSYVPYIGIFFIIGHYANEFMNNRFSLLYKYRQALIVASFVIGLVLLVFSYNRCKVWESSLTLWTDVIEKYPDADIAYLNRGIISAPAGNIKEAYADFAKAIELNPACTEAYNDLGLLKQNMNDPNGSIEQFNAAIKSDRNYTEAYSNRALSYVSLKKYDEALKDFTKALELKPDYANVYCNRGNAYIDIGQVEKGMQDLNKARELYIRQNDRVGFQRISERLEQLRGLTGGERDRRW
jgi:protein O-mannosyl-transferase